MNYEVVAWTRWMGVNWKIKPLRIGETRTHTSGVLTGNLVEVQLPQDKAKNDSDPAVTVRHSTFPTLELEYTDFAPRLINSRSFSLPELENGLVFPSGVKRRPWRSRLHVTALRR